MFCANCGTSNDDTAKFCKGCGQPLVNPDMQNTVVGDIGKNLFNTPNDFSGVNTPDNLNEVNSFNGFNTPNSMNGMNNSGDFNSSNAVNNQFGYNMSNGGNPVNGYGMPNGANMPNGYNMQPPYGQANSGAFVVFLKAVPAKIWAILGAALAVLIIIIVLIVNASNTINLNKYVDIKAEGYDGFGRVYGSINWEEFNAKYKNKIKYSSRVRKEDGEMLRYVDPSDIISDYIHVEIKSEGNISNGTEIEYSIIVDEGISEVITNKLKYTDGKYKVSGLEEVGKFDAFADVTVEFTGIAPNGYASINYLGSDLSYYDFDLDKRDGLKNGDVVKVTISEDKLEYYAQSLGKIPEILEKEYVVEGLESYLSKLDEIDDVAMSSMQQQASDVYNAYVAQNWDESSKLVNLTYIGNYLLTIKDINSWGTNNILFLVYKAQVRNTYVNDSGDKYDKINDIYWYIKYENLMVVDGKTNVNVTSYSTPYDSFVIDSGVDNGWWGTANWRYYGYATLDELYRVVVTSNIDSYNHEDNVDESVAPQTANIEDERDKEPAGATGDDYILPNSDRELISKSDLVGLSAEECKIARNEIYARHGRRFKDKELQAYFDSKDWYEGTIDAGDFEEGMLSDIEIKNKETIVAYEKEKGYN